jgi:hypothetical protein
MTELQRTYRHIFKNAEWHDVDLFRIEIRDKITRLKEIETTLTKIIYEKRQIELRQK